MAERPPCAACQSPSPHSTGHAFTGPPVTHILVVRKQTTKPNTITALTPERCKNIFVHIFKKTIFVYELSPVL